MAETNTKEIKATKAARPAYNLEEKVPVYVPRGAGDQLLSVGGRNWLLPEGQTSYVPRKVEMEYKRAETAKDLLAAEMAKRQQPSQPIK